MRSLKNIKVADIEMFDNKHSNVIHYWAAWTTELCGHHLNHPLLLDLSWFTNTLHHGWYIKRRVYAISTWSL